MENSTKRSILKIIKFTIALALICLLAFVGFKVGPYSRTAGNIIVSLAILLACGLLVTASHKSMQKNRGKLIVFAILYLAGVGIYDYLATPSGLLGILSPINNSLSVFFPSRGGYEEGFNRDIYYNILHLLAYLYFAMIMFSWFGCRAINSLGYYFGLSRCRNVFWGYSESGLMLAQDIIRKTYDQQVVFVLPKSIKDDKELDRKIFEKIDAIGISVIYTDFDQKFKVCDGHRHFFLNDDQDTNVKLALKLFEKLKITKCDSQLYIRTELDGINKIFSEQQETNMEVHVINQSDITAREFVKSYHPLTMPRITIDHSTCKVSGEFNILQLGFGWTGREVLNQVICNSQYVNSTFKATIIDKDINTKHGSYPILYKECIDEYHISINPCESEVGSTSFFDWLDDDICKYNRIIVALGDDALNVEMALTLSKLLLNNGCSSKDILYVHVRNVDKYSYYKDANSQINIFGDLANVYSYDVIVNERTDTLAKEMNLRWSGNKNKNAANEEWNKATIFSQDSSRGAAEGVSNTLKLLNMQYVSKNTKVNPMNIIDKDKFEEKISSVIDVLAENEHKRWNAFHFTQGIKLWDFTTVTYEEFCMCSSKKTNQVEYSNKHAALIAYSKLPELDAKLNGYAERWNQEHPQQMPIKFVNNQNNDKGFVQDIPMFISQIDCEIVLND